MALKHLRIIQQHFVFGFQGHEPTEGIVKLIRDYHVGCVIYSSKLFFSVYDAKKAHVGM